MKKFNAKFLREFEVGVEAESMEVAQRLVARIIAQFQGTARLLSIVAEDAVDEPCAACQEEGPIKPTPGSPHNKPTGGGAPGAGTAHVEILVDQIAKAA